jgi:thiosulfate/3-mercaptopyruvate sulfurtransferase
MTGFPTPLVSTAWLSQHLADPAVVVLDASWYLPGSGRDAKAEYAAGHIPGARFFDLDDLSDGGTALPHMLPDDAELGRKLGALGIGAASQVVVYDGSGANMSAGRAWWMLRIAGHGAVSVLDGGLRRWTLEGRALRGGREEWESVSFTSRLDRSRVQDQAGVAAALADGRAQVVDMRSAGRFSGRDPEPRAGLPSGHMPGARNLPFATLVDGDGLLLRGEALRGHLKHAGIDLDQPIVATCGSGVSACTLLLALEGLGISHATVYDGSWTEWASGGGAVVKDMKIQV